MRHYRRHLGPRFTEGSRLLWLAIEREGLSIAAAAAKLGWRTSALTRALYGENVPGVESLVEARRVFSVPIDAWAEDPAETFIPPAARDDEAEADESAGAA